MNEIKIEDLKQAIDQFAKVCYIMGKKEGLEGILEESPDEIRTIPLEALKEIIEEIKIEPAETMGFVIPAIKIEKVITSEAKEKELIAKFGKKKMEKLAKSMKFIGKILNKKKK